MTLLKKTLLFSLLILTINVQAEGWEYIKNNDYVQAEIDFRKALALDSLNKPALEGMIFLSEVKNETYEYQKFVTTYLRNFPDGYTYALFDNAFKGSDQEIVDAKIEEHLKLMAKVNLAVDFSESTKSREVTLKKYRELIPLYKWALAGPFDNVEGSGFIETYEIEKTPFDTTTQYSDHTDKRLKWIIPAYFAGTGRILFTSYLPETNSEATYFANTFLTFPETKTVQIRIARSAPIKVFLDDDLIFENNERVDYNYDREIIELEIPKGTHRLFIKNAQYFPTYQQVKSMYFFDQNYISQEKFAVRITDKKGNLINDISSAAMGEYQARKYTTNVIIDDLINHFKKEVEKNSESLFLQYALCKSYIKQGVYGMAEEVFVKKHKENPDVLFYTYLAAKSYAFRGKQEKVYNLFKGVDYDKVPIYDMLYEKASEIDLKTNKEKYFEAYSALLKIAPSNFTVINALIDYYNASGKEEEKDAFLKQKIEEYPEYEYDLETELSTYKEEYEGHSGAKHTLKEQKQAIKDLKKSSRPEDYELAIEYYKERKNEAKVLALYDELIDHNPHYTETYNDKAAYLIDRKKYDLAEKEIMLSLSINPYQSEAYEGLGDTYKKRERKEEALAAYKKAIYLNRSYWGNSSITEKIEKIEGSSKYKEIFDTITFDAVLNDPKWRQTAQNEDAIVLLYTKDVVMDSTGKIEVYQKFMVKILTEAGAEKWTQSNFNFLGNLQSIKLIKPDGSETTPESSGSYVVFKNLQEGDLIKIEGKSEFSTTREIDEELSFVNYYFFTDPLYFTKFEIAIPKGKKLWYEMHKLEDNVKLSTKGDFDFYRWEFRNMAAIGNEDALPDLYDKYPNIQISTLKNWNRVVKWYEQKTYRMFEPSYDIIEILDTIIQPDMTDKQKVEAVYNYITRQIKYSYVSFLNSAYIPKNPTNTCSSGIGDCKDVATIMITMLRQLGIESYYALVKTNNVNHFDMVPGLAFDHVIVAYYIDGKVNYADLTTTFFPIFVLPEMDCNAIALLVKEGVNDIFRLRDDYNDTLNNTSQMNIDVVFKEDRSGELTVNAQYNGLAGSKLREKVFHTQSNKQANLALGALGVGVFENIELLDFKYENLDAMAEPLRATYKLQTSGFLDKVSNLFILKIPYMVAMQKSQELLNSERKNRIDISTVMDSQPLVQKLTLSFPKGYKLTELPENVDVKNKFGGYSIHYKQVGDKLEVTRHQYFNKSIIELSEFEEFKRYYLSLLDYDKMKIAIQRQKKA